LVRNSSADAKSPAASEARRRVREARRRVSEPWRKPAQIAGGDQIRDQKRSALCALTTPEIVSSTGDRVWSTPLPSRGHTQMVPPPANGKASRRSGA
jgi:hypothetical protein